MNPEAKRLLRLVHVGRRELQMSEEDYRAMLQSVTGASSAKGLGVIQLDAVVTRMKECGFKVRQKASASGAKRNSPPSSAAVRAPEVRKIRAIWITMYQDGFLRDGSEDALGSYIQRMTANANGGVGINRAEWLTSPQADRVLEALKKWHIRLMTAAILERGGLVPDTLSSRDGSVAGYDRIRQAYEAPAISQGQPNR